jgi:hypothetical protein
MVRFVQHSPCRDRRRAFRERPPLADKILSATCNDPNAASAARFREERRSTIVRASPDRAEVDRRREMRRQ